MFLLEKYGQALKTNLHIYAILALWSQPHQQNFGMVENHSPIEGLKMFVFQKNLKQIKLLLKKWNKEEFKYIFKERKALEKEMETLQQNIIINGRKEEATKKEISCMQHLEDRYK